MNRDQVEGAWDRFAARVKQEWGKLTDNEVMQAEGNLDELIAAIQQKYGEGKEKIAERINRMKEESDSGSSESSTR